MNTPPKPQRPNLTLNDKPDRIPPAANDSDGRGGCSNLRENTKILNIFGSTIQLDEMSIREA